MGRCSLLASLNAPRGEWSAGAGAKAARKESAAAKKGSATRGFDRCAFAEEGTFYGFLAALAWAPLWYGSNGLLPWGINALLFPGLAFIYETLLLLTGKRHPVGIRNLALPAGLFAAVVLWILLQNATFLPAALAHPIWKMAASALGHPVAASMSVDRDWTGLALLRLLTVASAFWLALQLCREDRRALLLAKWVALLAIAYAAYGLIAVKAGWTPFEGARVSSTFVDRDSFATYAGLGLLAIAGLVLRFYQENAASCGNWRLSAFFFLDATGKGGALLFLGGFLVLAALLLTGSRGGVIATGLGLLLEGALLARGSRRRGERARTVLFFGSFFIAATALLFGGAFFGSIEKRGVYDASRMAVYILTLRSIRDLPWLGFGYGTFAEVFPMYRDRSLSVLGIWTQAHDTYLEIFQGLGLLFGSLLILAVFLLVLHCLEGARKRQATVLAPALAAGAALLVASHAFVDFSLQIEAVALSFASLLGAGVAQSQSSQLKLED